LGLSGMGRIATLGGRVRLVQGNQSAGTYELDHLCHELLWLGHVHQNQARRCQVKRLPGQTGVARVRVKHFDIRQVTVCAELLCALDLLKAAFYAHDFACDTDASRKQIETAPRAASDLDHVPTSANADLIEQSARIMGKFVGLSLQTLLLSLAVAQQVWIGFVHLSSS
jgi:hypothetical protein